MTIDSTLERTIAAHVASVRVDALAESSVRATCRDILDTLGCLIGGSGAPGIDAMRGLVLGWGGRAEATLALSGRRVPAPQAALVNGAMAHALDFDDTHDRAGAIHPGAPVLAASLAAAELRGGVRGDAFVAAVAIGLDLACRLALAAAHDRGWHRTSAIGVFGAAAAAARLLDLDAGGVGHALGIALSHAAGTRQCIDDGAMTKRVQAGHAASAGVLSAVLAARGVTGAHRSLTGRHGFFALYQPDDLPGEAIVADLGRRWEGDGLSLKPYPCFRPAHGAIDAALAVRDELGPVRGESISGVTLEADRTNPWVARSADPGEGRRPAHAIEAQFATPFLVAVALCLGRVGIDDVARVDDPQVLALAARTGCRGVADRPVGWVRVTVVLADGRRASAERIGASGSPHSPMSDAALDAKFRDCARHAVVPLSDDAVDAAIAQVRSLPTAADATGVLRGLAPAGDGAAA